MSIWPRNATVRPLPLPAEDHPRERSNFSAGWGKTLLLLDRELVELDAENIVLQIDVTEGQLRRADGMPRADARPASPAVAIAFNSSKGSLRYACDRFSDWRDNVRAIALGLEALRKIDRYGIGSSNEQYKGWLALEASPSGETPRQLLERFARVDGELAVADAVTDASLYRAAIRNVHPDRGGDPADYQAVNEAWNNLQAVAAGAS